MKKLLFIPLDYQYKPHNEWYLAFKGEYDCLYYSNLDEAVNFQPDFIFSQCSAIPILDMLFLKKETKAYVIQWTGDARDEIMENVTNYRGIADLTLLATGIGQRNMYEDELKHPVRYLQQGAFLSFFLPVKKLEAGSTVFIGNNYDQFEGARERTSLCRQLCSDSAFEVIGNGYVGYNNTRSIDYHSSNVEYNNAYISISHACFNEIEGYYSNRTLDIMMSGGCCLMKRVPKIEMIFPVDTCVFYKNNKEALDMIK